MEKRILVQCTPKSNFFTLNLLLFNEKISHIFQLGVKGRLKYKQLYVKILTHPIEPQYVASHNIEDKK